MTDIDWENMPEWADVWVEPKHEDEIGRGWHLDDGDRWKKQEGYYWLKKDAVEFFDVYYPPEKHCSGSEEGFPPVGTVCEAFFMHGASAKWRKCEVLMVKETECAVFVPELNALGWCKKFRPIPSPRDEWVEKVSEITEGLLGQDGGVIAKIYDALLRGDLPVPGELSDDY